MCEKCRSLEKRETKSSLYCLFLAANIDAPVIDEVNTSDLLLLDQDGFLEGTVVFEENVVMSSVLSGTGLLDGCDVMEVCKYPCYL